MKWYLLRHGLAAEPAHFLRDSDRPLTEEGLAQLEHIARGMKALDLDFDLVLSSPYVRARQTAERVAEHFRRRNKLVFSEHLTPHGNHKELIAQLRSMRAEALLLVGHEPHLSGLISLLISGRAEGGITLKKGGLAKLAVGAPGPGHCAELKWLLTPKQLARLGRG